MHGIHVWTERTEDGEKREVRATKFGGKWSIQSKVKSDEDWVYHHPPSRTDLETLLDLLNRKWQRRRAAYEDVKAIEKILQLLPKDEDDVPREES